MGSSTASQGVPRPPQEPSLDVPLAASIVLARLRLCRPLGLFSKYRLKAITPGESRSPQHLGARTTNKWGSVGPTAGMVTPGWTEGWDIEINISRGLDLVPSGTSVLQLVAGEVDGVQDGVGVSAERLGHPLRKVAEGRRTPPGDAATTPWPYRDVPPCRLHAQVEPFPHPRTPTFLNSLPQHQG